MPMEKLSPIAAALVAENPKAVVSNYRGAAMVERFGDPADEFRAMLSGCAVFDMGWRTRIKVTGEDRVRWLNGMVTNTATLGGGDGNYSLVLSPQGRIQADLEVFQTADGPLLLETDEAQRETLLKWLDHYIIMDDVALEDLRESKTAICVAGVTAAAAIGGGDVAPMKMVATKITGCDVTVVRKEPSAVPTFEVWCNASDALTIWRELIADGAAPAGWRAMEMLRIASGVPLFGRDITDKTLAQETGQTRALNFTKGCYIGQEIVERVRSRGAVHRMLSTFRLASLPETLPAPITADDKQIGTLTSAADLPLAGGAFIAGLGIARLDALESGANLAVEGVAMERANLPFVRAEP